MAKDARLDFLPRDEYEYFELLYDYESKEYYDAQRTYENGVLTFRFERKPLPEKLDRECGDTLYQPYWESPEAYAITDGGRVRGYVEFDIVEWNATLRITQLLVNREDRRRGYGRFAVNEAKKKAIERGCRQVIVETQTCNIGAVDFYLSQGFCFSGTNIFFYSNDDIGENEVMLEMSMLL